MLTPISFCYETASDYSTFLKVGHDKKVERGLWGGETVARLDLAISALLTQWPILTAAGRLPFQVTTSVKRDGMEAEIVTFLGNRCGRLVEKFLTVFVRM